MGTKNNAELLNGCLALYIGTAGAAVGSVTNLIGYVREIELSADKSENEIRDDCVTYPLLTITTEQSIQLSFNLMQPNLELMTAILDGVSQDGGTISFGNATNAQFSMKMVGTDSAGTARTYYLPYVQQMGGYSQTFKIGELQELQGVTVTAIKDDSVAYVMQITDATSSQTTLSSDTMTYVDNQAAFYVNAESGTTDDLATISGGSPSSGDTILIAPATGDTITVLETGNINLLASADVSFAMSGNDQLTLAYDGASDWDEVSRVTIV